MKRFKLWLLERQKFYQTTEFNADKLREEGWRAALEWVLQDCEYTGDTGVSRIDQEIIEEELKE